MRPVLVYLYKSVLACTMLSNLDSPSKGAQIVPTAPPIEIAQLLSSLADFGLAGFESFAETLTVAHGSDPYLTDNERVVSAGEADDAAIPKNRQIFLQNAITSPNDHSSHTFRCILAKCVVDASPNFALVSVS